MHRIKLYFLLLLIQLILFGTGNLFGQQKLGIQWARSLGGSSPSDFSTSVYQSRSGGFIVSSTIQSSDGDVLPNPNNINSVAIWIKRFDSQGRIIWKKTYGGTASENSSQVIQTKDGGFAFVGSTNSNDLDVSGLHGTPRQDGDCWLVKTDSNGAILWQRCIGGTLSEAGTDLVEFPDGSLAVGGFTKSLDGDMIGRNPEKSIFIFKVSSDGSTIFWKTFIGGYQNEELKSVKLKKDGSLILLAHSEYPNFDFENPDFRGTGSYLIRLDALGKNVWTKALAQPPYPIIAPKYEDFVISKENDYFLVGDFSFGNFSTNHTWVPIVTKFNENGNLIWKKDITSFDLPVDQNDGAITNFKNLAFTPDSSSLLMLGGYLDRSTSFDGIRTTKIDLEGSIKWQKIFSRIGGQDFPSQVVALSNESAIVVGATSVENFIGTGNCLVFKIGEINEIQGSVFTDNNGNGIREANEKPFDDAIITVQGGVSKQVSQPFNGKFSFQTDSGNFVTSVSPQLLYYQVFPATKSSSFSSYFNTDTISFAVRPIPGKRDLRIDLIPLTFARPGFEASYLLSYKNIGTDTVTPAKVIFVKPANTNVLNSQPAYTSTKGDTIFWELTNLKPLDTGTIQINLKIANPPTTNIGDSLKYLASINSGMSDLTEENNISKYLQFVTGSFDPNDKSENVGGKIQYEDLPNEQYLNYLIRFQNTGTDTAFDIQITDTLDNKLDWNSFKMISSSHAYQLNIKEGNKLTWTFEKIKLPDSNRNEPKSHGFVAFQIKPKTTLSRGDIIKNSASIYFDFNQPIVTNTAKTTITSKLVTSVGDLNRELLNLSVYPNPNNGVFYLNFKPNISGSFIYRVTDLNGKIIVSDRVFVSRNSSPKQINLYRNKIAPGIYVISLEKNGKKWLSKIILL